MEGNTIEKKRNRELYKTIKNLEKQENRQRARQL